jgi:hypothetical protein
MKIKAGHRPFLAIQRVNIPCDIGGSHNGIPEVSGLLKP